MEDANFKIYSASAGSGKTYALAKEYLKLLLTHDAPSKFRQILAITFTNKAVDEMKTRILDNLYAFGLEPVPKKQAALFHEICSELSLEASELRERSKLILKRILHNYSFFEISTIDKFNHKIIKTFARDLHLSQNFEVELDTDMLLEEAVGNLLERAGTDEALTDVLIAFSLEKIDEDKSWNIALDLIEMGKLLFQENHADHVAPLRSKTIGDFKDIQQRIAKRLGHLEQQIVLAAQTVLKEIESQGFEFADFPRQTLPNHFKKMTDGEFSPSALYTSKTLEPNLVEGKILKANDKRDVSSLAPALLQTYLSQKEKIYRHRFLKNIYGNIVPMTVLNEIAKEIKHIELERDIIPISSLNAILSKEIKGQPVPFIYERMGEKYRHYFIDEFQDTSKMQWENLVPLIGNALESENERQEKGSLFLVGDVKQAIYRWRGGRAEQFLNLINGTAHPFSVEPMVRSLDTNWRSCDTIVEFNNSFFTTLAPVMENQDYQNLFLHDSHQKTNNIPGGFVHLTVLDKDLEDKDEAYCDEVLQTIHQIKSKNNPYSDICILVRDNNKAMVLANHLATNRIPIISSEALLLGTNVQVNFLVALLRVIQNKRDREAAYFILTYLCKDENDAHQFITTHLDAIDHYLSITFAFDIQVLQTESTSTILEKAISQFGLATGSAAHITFLMDEVLDLEKREGPSIHAFLTYWEIKKDSLSIAAPDDVDAVRIMTVHKSKGLEFPFVIFPFANATLKKPNKKIWAPASSDEDGLELDEFLLNTNKDLLEFNSITHLLYKEEEQKSVLDAMNVLYVALTRPVKGLFVVTETGKKPDSLSEASSYADLFGWFLQQQQLTAYETGKYLIGTLPEISAGHDITVEEGKYIPYITRPIDDPGFVISTKSGRLWDDTRTEAIEMGNVIHHALSQIKTLEDVPTVLEQLNTAGDFPKENKKEIEQKIRAVVEHPKLSSYFSSNGEVLNEQEILMPNGLTLRPDRISIHGDQAILIDYKTGKPSPAHKEQIMQYADVLKDMGYQIKHAIIVYIDQQIELVFA